MSFLDWTLLIIGVAIVVVIVGTARGFWLQGSKLDRVIDDFFADVNDAREELAELRKEFEDFVGTERDNPQNTSNVTAKIAATNEVMNEEKVIRNQQTRTLGDAIEQVNARLQRVEGELEKKPSADVVNAVLEKAKSEAPTQ